MSFELFREFDFFLGMFFCILMSHFNRCIGTIDLHPAVGTHYCLAVGNDEGLELDETDEDEQLGESNKE